MEYEGMVHALEEIHRLLKPTGVLIDIHPVAEAPVVEIHKGGKIDLVDRLLVRQWISDYQQADNALYEIVERGLFDVERENVFVSLTHYTSVEEMHTDLREAIDKYARDAQSAIEAMPDAEALAARAEELIAKAASGAELIMRERAYIIRLKPI